MPVSDDAARDRFAALYDQHYPAVLRYAARRIGAEAARDIAAETFLTAWRLLDVANAQCDFPMGAIPMATGQCTPNDYTEFNLPRAVPAYPHYQAHIPRLGYQAGGPYF